jgi:hypothetical protein
MAKERDNFRAKCSELDEKLPEYLKEKKDGKWKIRQCTFDKDNFKDECSANCLFEKKDGSSE